MAITTHTITGTIADLLGGAFEPVQVTVRTNLPDGEAPVDLISDQPILGHSGIDITSGVLTVDGLIDPGSADVRPIGIRYLFVIEYADPVTRRLASWSSGWLSITADGDLAALVAEQFSPPTWGNEISPEALAAAQGYWIVYSETAPTETTMYGQPVLWIDRSTALTPVPVNPPSPTWNDATGEFTVPSGVVGVDYVWTSGGGGVGAIVTQGSTVATSGPYPRPVVVTPAARPGYVLATVGLTFRHDFPNPAGVTIIASDAFTGGDTTTISGRTLDNTLGGSQVKVYAGAGDYFQISSGILIPTTTTGWHTIDAGNPNQEVEFEIPSVDSGQGEASTLRTFMLCIGGNTFNRGLVLQIGRRLWDVGCTVLAGGLQTFPGTPVAASTGANPIGTWRVRLFVKSATVVSPNGGTFYFDLTQTDSTHGVPDSHRGNIITWRNQAIPPVLRFDDLKVRTIA